MLNRERRTMTIDMQATADIVVGGPLRHSPHSARMPQLFEEREFGIGYLVQWI